MANPKYPIPRPGSPISETGSVATREWYNYWQNLAQGSGGPTNEELENDITIISEKLGSPDGTPQNIPPQESGGNVVGLNSIASIGVLPGIVTLTLQGDAADPGNTYYYGTGPSGSKGFYTVASAFLGTAGNIDLSVGADGVTTINLAQVTQGSTGTLRAITLDGFGRVVQNKAATITGTANRVTVTNGDASVGFPTIDIASNYAGQSSIVTLGPVTTGVWNATTVGPTFGGTGQTSYTAGDILYASASNTLSKRSIGTAGQILTVSGGLPVWAAPATSGTVTSVDVSGGTTGLTTSGGPVTASGTITLAGTLNIANGGTGQTTANAAFNALSPMTTNGDLIYRSGGVATRLAAGTNGQVLGITGGLPAWQAPSAGTVTSVGLAMPSQFTVTNSPITGSGTLTAAWNTQAANTALMGPASGSAAVPTFRAPVFADIPYPTDYISGLKLIWNSATSISVGTGSAVIPSTGKLEAVNSTLTLSSLSLSASTFYHVYLFDNSGTPAIECVTTAPASPYQGTARAKTGDTTRRYLGSVLTNASSQIYGFVHASPGRMHYASTAVASPFLIVNTTGSLSGASSAAGCIPSTGVTGQLRLQNTTNVPLSYGAGAPFNTAITSIAGGSSVATVADVPIGTDLNFWFILTSPSSGTCGVSVNGYEFER